MDSLLVLPQSLVRYRPVSGEYQASELENLARGKVWFRHLGGQNDCAEGVVPIVRSSEERLRSIYKNLRISALQHLAPGHEFCQKYRSVKEFRAFLGRRRSWQKKFTQNAPQRIRISCFSIPEKHDEEHMWEKYACEGRGYKLHYSLANDFMESDAPFWSRVFYGDKLDRKRVSEAELLAAEFQLNGVPVFDINPKQWVGVLQAFSACKTTMWSPEGEVRLVKYSLEEDGYFPVPNYVLTGVTFGKNTQDKLKNAVRGSLGESLVYG
ncbi:DUF2971 domain-containing protein [Leisingera sp. ANG-S5]|uniref:DUF2971 domain-containing protein n=1 Tax=Leisingera sp. ANG-S5 TaxID=1577901 RepID=UPI001269F26D|nr:DUF2971 domain-containing protein [Leisingera sp. ANG-S5]